MAVLVYPVVRRHMKQTSPGAFTILEDAGELPVTVPLTPGERVGSGRPDHNRNQSHLQQRHAGWQLVVVHRRQEQLSANHRGRPAGNGRA